MANPSPKTEHLEETKWKPGESGNPEGRPKGSKNLSTHIKEILSDESFSYQPWGEPSISGPPLHAMIKAMVIKAIEGDVRAFDILAKYGYGKEVKEELSLPEPIMGGISALSTEDLRRLVEASTS